MANRSSGTRDQGTRPQTQSGGQSGPPQTLSVEGALDELMDVDGAVGAAIVDYENGMTLGTIGGRGLDMELAGAGNTEVVRSERNIIHDLDLQDDIQDLLVSLKSSYHLIRMCERHEDVFIYLVIDRDDGNLGLARREIDQIDELLELT